MLIKQQFIPVENYSYLLRNTRSAVIILNKYYDIKYKMEKPGRKMPKIFHFVLVTYARHRVHKFDHFISL